MYIVDVLMISIRLLLLSGDLAEVILYNLIITYVNDCSRLGWLVEFYILALSEVISERVPFLWQYALLGTT